MQLEISLAQRKAMFDNFTLDGKHNLRMLSFISIYKLSICLVRLLNKGNKLCC